MLHAIISVPFVERSSFHPEYEEDPFDKYAGLSAFSSSSTKLERSIRQIASSAAIEPSFNDITLSRRCDVLAPLSYV